MGRYKIITITILGLMLLGFVGTCIYFVAGVSATADPIKSYDYPGDITKLEKNLKELIISNQNISYENSDTTGSDKNGYAYYLTFKFKDFDKNIEYTVCYEKKANRGLLELTEAIDLSHLTGGYISQAKGVKDLVNLFEIYILPKLKE